eukprot:TRINITY_DN12068_c0_g2_i4.p1 TRINITY_DN12068_c0_g2~~TRINITY_DN12068_c0_g2_i4.p1  ORF type:complete len:275 (+),score=23.95 TRINITY_DN12068_c0_g2_i4:79-825(+)
MDNSDPFHPSVRTSRVFIVFKHAPIFLLILDKINPSDGKHPRFLPITLAYPEFAPTYKWCHFMRICSCCGLAGHLAPACPARSVFITTDIWAISHTDPSPPPSFLNKVYEGEVVFPNTQPSPHPNLEEKVIPDTSDDQTVSTNEPLSNNVVTVPKVEHLRFLFTFLPMFKFVKHGPDIERSLAVFVSLENRRNFVDTLWKECIVLATDQPQIEPNNNFGENQPNIQHRNNSTSLLGDVQDEYSHPWDL